jgi:hypothetical protein
MDTGDWALLESQHSGVRLVSPAVLGFLVIDSRGTKMSVTCNKRHSRDPARHFVSLVARRLLVIAGVLSALILTLCLVRRPKPPDLSTCTRIEVRYAWGALRYFFPSTSMQKEVLNEEERKYIRSYDKWTVTDREQIKAFAQQVSQGTYVGWCPPLMIALDPPTKIIAYRPWGLRVPVSVYEHTEITAGWRRFSYDEGHLLSLRGFDPPGLKPLRARWYCVRHLCYLINQGLWEGPHVGRPHLDPNRWCDTIVEHYRSKHTNREIDSVEVVRMYPDTYIARVFTCPGIRASTDFGDYRSPWHEASQPVDTWISDYAMNPNCRVESPEGMVFLFESKPGWNQHGGPELFTLDNHDPKGGCVLLNDGTVKFIRTEEELKQLRWK